MERLTDRINGNAYYPKCFEKPCYGEGSTENCDKCDFNFKVCEKITAYEESGLEPKEVHQLIENEAFWHKEAVRLAAEIGEIKIKLGGFIEKNSRHKELTKELEAYRKKLERLKELKKQEPDNNYHEWDKEVSRTEHNIAECLRELDLER